MREGGQSEATGIGGESGAWRLPVPSEAKCSLVGMRTLCCWSLMFEQKSEIQTSYDIS